MVSQKIEGTAEIAGIGGIGRMELAGMGGTGGILGIGQDDGSGRYGGCDGIH